MTLYPSTTPPQTTAIYGDFKKSTAISKGYNVGLRYIMCIVELWLGLSYRLASFIQNFVCYMQCLGDGVEETKLNCLLESLEPELKLRFSAP
jgi:hypothetical protein